MTFQEALAFSETLDIRLIPYELADGMEGTRKILDEIRPGQSVGIFIGPEGGFEKEEVGRAVEAGGPAHYPWKADPAHRDGGDRGAFDPDVPAGEALLTSVSYSIVRNILSRK